MRPACLLYVFKDVAKNRACASQHKSVHIPLPITAIKLYYCICKRLAITHRPDAPVQLVAPGSEVWLINGGSDGLQPDLLHSLSCLAACLIVARLKPCMRPGPVKKSSTRNLLQQHWLKTPAHTLDIRYLPDAMQCLVEVRCTCCCTIKRPQCKISRFAD